MSMSMNGFARDAFGRNGRMRRVAMVTGVLAVLGIL